MRVVACWLLLVLMCGDVSAQGQWPQFRGPTGDGQVAGSGYPRTWSEKQGVLWKTPIHDRGWSSPVIWGDQIWVTTGTADGRRLFAVAMDRETGEVVHDILVFEVDKPDHVAPSNSYASPTPVIEAGRVYVHFGTNGTACLDTDTGRILWTRRDLHCNHEQGAGSSPILFEDKLVFHVDGRDVQYVVALDTASGETVWKSNRSEDYSRYEEYQRKGYCIPIVITTSQGRQLISPAAKGVFAYDPETGRELWKVRHQGWSMAPRPLFGRGLVFAVVDYDHPAMWAIRPEAKGDVTESHVVWKLTTGVPSRPSALLIDELLYFVNSDGIASCVEADTGEVIWKDRVPGKFSASPLYADGRIYCFNEEGVTTVLKPGRRFEVLATNSLADEPMMASPAAVGGSFFLRTESHLYRVGETPSH